MGIQGLLPLLKSIQKPTHLRNFAGQTLGIDAYGWLHRGTVSCAIELAQQKPTTRHIDFAISRVRMLLHFGVKPYLVFDGDYLPSKAHTERERAARRRESRKAGLELLAMNRVSQAYTELQKSVDVTPLMARELIEELKRLGVPYIVAPYEADSQLTYLENQGIIDGVLSEDSDLLVFGVRCLLTKLDQFGECIMVNRDDFTACREVSLVGWTLKEFRMMAMLSGCDYLPGIGKMGLKSAYRLVRTHKALERIIRSVQFDGKMKVPPGYLEAFEAAERTFLYQWVYCPQQRGLVNLNTIPAGLCIADMPYLGPYVEPAVAAGVALGELDPNTKQALAYTPRTSLTRSRSTITSTPDEKHGKPISEFFKPKRTPLAELDPNAFTPSPSQRQLLVNQQNVSWSASNISTSHSQPVPSLPSSAPQLLRRATTDQYNTQKRQRLCADTALATSMGGSLSFASTSTTSRFFAKNDAVEPSPSTRKARARDDFELWSDDSTVEAMEALERSQSAAVGGVAVGGVAKEGDAVEKDAIPDDATQEDVINTKLPKRKKGKVAVFVDETNVTAPSIFSAGVNARFSALAASFKHGDNADAAKPSRTEIPDSSPPEAMVANSLPTDEKSEVKKELDSDEAGDQAGSSTRPSTHSTRAQGQGSEDLFLVPCSPTSPRIGCDDGDCKEVNEGEDDRSPGVDDATRASLRRFAFIG